MPRLASWTADEASGAVLDTSGNGHDFSLAGNLIRTAAGDGYTYGGSFPNSKALTGSAAVTTPNGPAIFGQTANRTAAAWVRRTNNGVDGWLMEMKDVGGNTGVWGILFTSSNVQARGRNAGGVAFAQAAQPAINTWYHVAATYDGTSLRLYLDGVLAATTALAGPMRTDADDFYVFDGAGTETRTDSLELWDEELDATEITALMGSPPGAGAVSGTAAATLPAPGGTTLGTRTVLGTAQQTLTGGIGVASGVRSTLGTAGGALAALAVAASGVRTTAGAGSASLVSLAGSGSGSSPGDVTGTGTAVLPAVAASALVAIGASLEWLTLAELEQCRLDQESIMFDRVRIRHFDPVDGAFDQGLGYKPSTLPAPFYVGKARVQARPIQSGETASGGQPITRLGYVVAVPWWVDQSRPTDIVEVYQSWDPDHVTKTLRVADVQSSTFVTARRMSCLDYQPREPAT